MDPMTPSPRTPGQASDAAVFLDGSRVTPGTEKCKCDTDGRRCEFPCWQRLGVTDTPCCPDCAPLPAVEN